MPVINGVYTKDFPALGRAPIDTDIIPIAEVANQITYKTTIGAIFNAKVFGTTGRLSKFTGANTLGNSILNEIGNAIHLTNGGLSYASFGIINPGTPGDPGIDNDAYIGSTINNDFTIRVNNTEAARFDTALRFKIANIQNATTDTDKFLVSDGGVVKYRTGAQVLSDIGGQGALTLTTSGTSGASTLIGNTLNIPNYSPDLSGYVTLNTAQTITAAKTFTTSGGSNTLVINHSSGSGIALSITKGGNGEGIYVNKTSGSGNAVTIIGTLNATTLVKNGGTSNQFLKADGSVDSTAYGTGSVTSVSALTLGTSGTDLNSSVANGTTTPVITLNVPDASASNRGVVTTGAQTFAGGKTFSSDLTVNTLTVGRGGGAIISNTAFGINALLSNTTGQLNTSIGYNSGALTNAGAANQTSQTSVYIGADTRASANGNTNEIVIGTNSRGLGSNTTALGNSSTVFGRFWGNLLVGNSSNSGEALQITGTSKFTGLATFSVDAVVNGVNIGLGGGAISSNTRVGTNALNANTTGSNNTSSGAYSLAINTTGGANSASGVYALTSNTTGYQNTAKGFNALSLNSTGYYNTGIGVGAGDANTTGFNNIFLGYNSTGESATESNRTWIGNTDTTSTWLGGNLLLGSRTNAGNRLEVIGTAGNWAGSFTGNTTTGQSFGAIIRGGTNSSDVAFNVNNAANSVTYLRVRGDGNVGIGTTSPGSKLTLTSGSNFVHINGGGSSTVPFLGILNQASYATATYGWGFFDNGTNGNLDLKRYLGSSTAIDAVTFERSTGNVGINATTITQPSAGATTLRIVGTATTKAGAIRLDSSDSSVSAYIYPDSTSGLSINTSTAHPIVLRTNGTERMRIWQTTGNVNIGTTPASDAGYKLDVNGTGRFSGLTLSPESTDLQYENVQISGSSYIRRYVFRNGNLNAAQKIRLSNTTNVAGRTSAMFFVKINQISLVSNTDTHHSYAVFSFRVRVPLSGGVPVIHGLTTIATYGWDPATEFTFTGTTGGIFTLDFANNTGLNTDALLIDMEMISAGAGNATMSGSFTQSTI